MKNIQITGSYTDYYQITMGQAYFLEGRQDIQACFDYFFRKLPFEGGFVVFAGLQEVLETLEDFRFSEEDMDFFAERELNKDFLDYLKNFKFRGTIYSSYEGDVVFPVRPVLRVEGNLIETQLVETIILNYLNYSSLIATKAARMRLVAGEKLLSDFGLRRAQGLGGINASNAAIIGGFDSTSNVYSALKFGLKASGTMAHSYIQSLEDEVTAFRNYARAHPDSSIFLVDTYDTLKSGLPKAIKVAKEMEEEGHKLLAVRLDSGDLAYLAKKTRQILDENGLDYVKIVASNQLDEYLIKSLLDQEAPIDIFGVGTSLVTGEPDAALDGVYKLAMSNDKPRLKLSENISKITLPGIKQVYRLLNSNGKFYGGDVVCLENEENPAQMHHPFDKEKKLDISKFEKEKLLHKVMENGESLIEPKSAEEVQNYVEERLEMLPEEYLRFDHPHEYKIGLSSKLNTLRQELIKKHTHS